MDDTSACGEGVKEGENSASYAPNLLEQGVGRERLGLSTALLEQRQRRVAERSSHGKGSEVKELGPDKTIDAADRADGSKSWSSSSYSSLAPSFSSLTSSPDLAASQTGTRPPTPELGAQRLRRHTHMCMCVCM